MCAGCFTHVLADARLRDEMATCPSCRVEISKTSATRNLAVENAVSELPSDCQFCGKQYPRNSLDRHEEQECEERLVWLYFDRCQYDSQCLRRNSWCKFSRIGCPWRGPEHERQEHENQCAHPHRTGAEVMDSLLAMDQEMTEEKKLYDNIFDLLGYEKITFNGISRYCQACTVKLTQNSRNPTETVPYWWVCASIVLRIVPFLGLQQSVGGEGAYQRLSKRSYAKFRSWHDLPSTVTTVKKLGFSYFFNFLVDFKIKIPDASQSELHCAQRPSGGYQSETEDLRVWLYRAK